MTLNISAQSPTVRAIGPTVSMLPANGRPQAGHAVDRRGKPDRAAGVRAQRAEARTGGDGGAGTTARAGREPVRVPRVAARPVVRIVGGGTPGELVHVRLADDDRA